MSDQQGYGLEEHTIPESRRPVDGIEGRISRVEIDQLDLRREFGMMKDKMHEIHLDLARGNVLTEGIKDSVVRIETNTANSFDRIEKHTKDALNELKESVRGAVDMATTARMVNGLPIGHVVTGVATGAVAAVAAVVAYLKGVAGS
jgi:hypothetical protein